MAADDDGEKSPFRCLAAARYAVASVVTVLVLVVVVQAIKVVHRPDSLPLGITQGTLFMRRLKQPQTLLGELNLRIYNPRNRARIYFVNFTAYCFYTNSASPRSSRPGPDSLVYFPLFDRILQQRGEGDFIVLVNGTRGGSMEESIFDVLYDNTDVFIRDVTMLLEGNIITELHSGYNTTPRWTTYYCWPLSFGVDLENIRKILSLNLKDVFCWEEQGRHFI